MTCISKKIKLMSFDGHTFVVDEAVAAESQTIKNMIEDDCVDGAIPLPNITGKILSKVIEYCKKHVNVDDDEEQPLVDELKVWDAKFMDVDHKTLVDLLSAANYLNLRKLLDLTCQTVADKIKGKSTENIRRIFDIKNDFTREEEEELRREEHYGFD